MNITTLLKNTKLRFKTTAELAQEFGTVWMDNSPYLDPSEMLTIVSYNAGKPVIKGMVKGNTNSGLFRYGPTESMAHVSLLTTKSFPKYSVHGDILKPGMLVTIVNIAGLPNPRVSMPAFIRNAPGTTVKIIKVVNPFACLTTHFKMFGIKQGEELYDMLNRSVIATEFRVPASILYEDDVINVHPSWFEKGKICAFETSWRLRFATETERKQYYQTIWG